MIEGVFGIAQDVFSTEQKAEQECLFYVALSRARDRLFFYAPNKKSNGHQWSLSPFLDRLNGLNKRTVTPDRVLPDALEDNDIELVIDGGLKFSASQISQYESCPRRFFYTHVLQVGGRRKETALMKLHEIVRTITQALVADSVAIDTDDPNLEKKIWEAMIAHQLTDCSYAGELKNLATELIQYFVAKRVGYTPESPTSLKITLNNAEIVIHVDDVLVDRDGKRVFRRIQTGHMPSTENKDVGTAAFQLAAQQAFPDATVEFLYLSDKKAHSVSLSTTELQNRHKKLVGFLNNIQRGRFPTDPSTRTCSGCPAFFVCGSTPAGALSKKF